MLDIFTYILCSIIVSIEIEGDWGGGVFAAFICVLYSVNCMTRISTELSRVINMIMSMFCSHGNITGKKSCLIHLNASAGRIFVLPGHSKQHNNAGIIQNATVCGWASHIFR